MLTDFQNLFTDRFTDEYAPKVINYPTTL